MHVPKHCYSVQKVRVDIFCTSGKVKYVVFIDQLPFPRFIRISTHILANTNKTWKRQLVSKHQLLTSHVICTA
jgi:hypothetical protein